MRVDIKNEYNIKLWIYNLSDSFWVKSSTGKGGIELIDGMDCHHLWDKEEEHADEISSISDIDVWEGTYAYAACDLVVLVWRIALLGVIIIHANFLSLLLFLLFFLLWNLFENEGNHHTEQTDAN